MNPDEKVWPLARQFWANWEAQPVRDEETLRHFTLALVGKIERLAREEDWTAAERLIEAYDFGADLCRDEPLLTAYELGRMLIMLTQAEHQLMLGEFDACLGTLDRVLLLLEAGDLRRRAVEMRPRPNSEVRYLALGLLAAVKWEGPGGLRDRVMTPEQIALQLPPIAERVYEYLEQYPAGDAATNQRVRENLLLAELDLAKMAYKYLPDDLALILAGLADRHGVSLPLKVAQATEDEQHHSAVYDFALACLGMDGACTQELIEQLDAARREAVPRSFKTLTLTDVVQRWDRQRDDLIAALDRGLRLVDFAAANDQDLGPQAQSKL